MTCGDDDGDELGISVGGWMDGGENMGGVVRIGVDRRVDGDDDGDEMRWW